jgi:beta-glucanase (GH16 family)
MKSIGNGQETIRQKLRAISSSWAKLTVSFESSVPQPFPSSLEYTDTAGNGQTHRDLTDTNQNYHDYTVCSPHFLFASFSNNFHPLLRLRRAQIDWQPDKLRFLIDGQEVRSVNKQDTLVDGVYQYPTTPARVQLSVWAGGLPTSPQVRCSAYTQASG